VGTSLKFIAPEEGNSLIEADAEEEEDRIRANVAVDKDIGRIGENIVTNEFLWRGFIVTHLDKGTRGVSANADLMIGHSKSREPLLVQVKACLAKKAPNWVFVGNLTENILNGVETMYNRKAGFHSDVLAAVSISNIAPNATSYRIFVMPIKDAERIIAPAFKEILCNFKEFWGESRKIYSKVYLSLNTTRLSRSKKFITLLPAAKRILKYENALENLTD
jgi:hypothetical protein